MRGIPRTKASNAENVYIWWRHHEIPWCQLVTWPSTTTALTQLYTCCVISHVYDPYDARVQSHHSGCWYHGVYLAPGHLQLQDYWGWSAHVNFMAYTYLVFKWSKLQPWPYNASVVQLLRKHHWELFSRNDNNVNMYAFYVTWGAFQKDLCALKSKSSENFNVVEKSYLSKYR